MSPRFVCVSQRFVCAPQVCMCPRGLYVCLRGVHMPQRFVCVLGFPAGQHPEKLKIDFPDREKTENFKFYKKAG